MNGTRTLSVYERVTSAYNPGAVRGDWSAHTTPYLSYTLTSNSKTANIKAEEKRYGNTGWIGLAQVWVSGGHITRAQIKLNTWYDAWYPWLTDPDKKQSVYCMEFGHVLGLDHNNDGATGGTPDDTCMNEDRWEPRPNAHDDEQLDALYAHSDDGSASSNRSKERGPFTIHVYPAPDLRFFK